MFRCYRCVITLFLLITSSLFAHPGHHHEIDSRDPKTLPNFEYDKADVKVEATLLGKPLEYDADVLTIDNSTWFSWLEFTRDRGDRIWVGSRNSKKWNVRKLVVPKFGTYASPKLTSSKGQLWLSYELLDGDQWDIVVAPLSQDGILGKLTSISTGKGSDIHHDVKSDHQGGLWFTWQSDINGQFDIVARHFTKEKQQPIVTISSSLRGDWQPALATESNGNVHIAWDGFNGESFNVCLRSLKQHKWQEKIVITNKTTFQGRAQIAVEKPFPSDPENEAGSKEINDNRKIWIAWEEGSKNWGRPFRGIKTETLTSEHGPLHRERQIQMAAIGNDNSIHLLKYPLPMPSRKKAAHRKFANKGAKSIGSYYEHPQIVLDDSNRLWVVYRHNYCPWLGVIHRSHKEKGFGIYARYRDGGYWSKLYRFSVDQGDGMQNISVEPTKEGIVAVWTTGRTHRTKNKRPRGIVSATISAPVSEALSESYLNGVERRTEKLIAIPPRPQPMIVGKTKYQLFFGDLHRHTDISLCRAALDGTIDDTYRYAIDVARLDFLGITDHSRDIAMGDVGSLLWWRCQKEVPRHQLDKSFFPFFAYERSHGNTADHNVISLRNNLLRPYTYPIPEFWKELDADTITIPHQPIRRDTWKYQNDQLRPLVEIFQGCRDNSIEKDVHNGLAKGYHLGFIASSDHSSTSASYASVWAKEASRESIFRAMQDRRTFGATTNIRLVVTTGHQWMGERVKVKTFPPVQLIADGTTVIKTIEMVIDGKIVKTFNPNKQHVELTMQPDLKDAHYIYFHLTQTDGNEAWSSPIWWEKK